MVLLLDLDGTILGSKVKKNEIRNEIAKKLNISKIDNKKYYNTINEVLKNNKIKTRKPIFEKIVSDSEKAKKIAKIYNDKSLSNSFVYEDAKNLLENYEGKLGLITNGPEETQNEKLRKFNLNEYFDQITISGELGYSKPGKEIFNYTLKKLDSKPENSIYVGNVPELDVKGANNANMTSVLVKRDEGESTQSTENTTPDYEITNLEKVIEIIENENIRWDRWIIIVQIVVET